MIADYCRESYDHGDPDSRARRVASMAYKPSR